MKCKVVESHSDIQEFLKLSDKLYKDDNTRDKKLEEQILKGKHILSDDFKVKGIVVLNEKEDVIGRCITTIYEGDENIYFGFFDVISSKEAVKCLFHKVNEIGIMNGKKNIIGPVDCSFWLGYRFKVSGCNKPYICEPYNKYYYKNYLEEIGFKVTDKYVSNRYRIPKESDINEKYIKRLEKMKNEGYIFVNLNYRDFDRYLSDIYELLIELYSSFPCYKPITKEKFIKLFKGLKYILNYRMDYLAYKDGKLKGFMINIPNYGNLASNKSIINILKMLIMKNKIKDYILLYMGVDKDSLGLASALAEITKRDLCKYKFTSIGALIHEGKVSNSFYKELIEEKYEYVLMGREINEE